MKKLLLLSITLMLLMTTYLFARDEFEFGLGITPMDVLKSEADKLRDETVVGEGGFLADFILNFHAGYSFAWLFYASVDANAMPPWWVEKQTASEIVDPMDPTQTIRQAGILEPGFVTFIDVGIRPTFGSFLVIAELGINHLYIRGGGDTANKIGVNFRAGAGYMLSPFSINLIGTLIFPDFETMKYVFESAEEDWAKEMMQKSIIPSLNVYIHL